VVFPGTDVVRHLKLFASAGCLAGLLGCLVAVPAQAGGAATVTAITRIVNAGTVPGNGGKWASDSFTRTATLTGGERVSPGLCGRSSGTCYGFTAMVSDQGTFRSLAGVLTPNQSAPGKRVLSEVTGSVTGRAVFAIFYATTLPDANLVPSFAANTWTAATWPDAFFPKGSTLTGLDLGPWSLTYTASAPCGGQQWRDSSGDGYGDLPFDGNILGCRTGHHR
jgi:hypothetical protein